jgi:hypothetical protein
MNEGAPRSREPALKMTKFVPQARQWYRVKARNSNDTSVSIDPQCPHSTVR